MQSNVTVPEQYIILKGKEYPNLKNILELILDPFLSEILLRKTYRDNLQ